MATQRACMATPPYLRRTFEQSRPKNLVLPRGKWFDVKAAADVADVYVYDEIGGWGITAGELVQQIQDIEAPSIELHISSPGGDVFEAIAILSCLQQHPAVVNVSVDGWAASAASVIAMAGERVQIAPGGLIMIHDAWGVAVGNEADVRAYADLLGKTSANVAGIYAAKAGGTPDEWRTAMQAETWYNADEAVEAGLADQKIGAGDSAASGTTAAASARTPAVVNKLEPAGSGFDFAEMFRAAVKEAVS